MNSRLMFDHRQMERDAVAAGFNATALAKRAKASPSLVMSFFAGRKGLSPAVAKRIAKVIHQPLAKYVVDREQVGA